MASFKIIIKILSIIVIFALHIYGRKIAKFIPIELNIYEAQNIKELRKSAAECTLFLNKDDSFPLSSPGKIILIGSGARNTPKGSMGSAEVDSRFYVTCEQGLENAGFEIVSKDWLDKFPEFKNSKRKKFIDFVKFC